MEGSLLPDPAKLKVRGMHLGEILFSLSCQCAPSYLYYNSLNAKEGRTEAGQDCCSDIMF